jgi:DNA-binding Lrp family transcriptional regulator
LDSTDTKLLALLEADARAPVAELARKLKLARSTVQDRLARLGRSGEIAGYTIRRKASSGRAIRAQVMLTVDPKQAERIVADLKALAVLRRLVTVSGAFDLMAEIAADTTEALDDALDEIGRLKGVQKTMSSVVLSVKAERGE